MTGPQLFENRGYGRGGVNLKPVGGGHPGCVDQGEPCAHHPSASARSSRALRKP